MSSDLAYHGRPAILIDEARDVGLIFAAARDIDEQDLVLMVAQGGICTVTINETTAISLGLFPQGSPPRPGEEPYFVNSVESRACTETGISARERAITMRTLGRRDVGADDVHSPGHIMVQVARNVLRADATLPELANLLLAATTDTRFAGWCDILDERGEVAGAAHCRALAERIGVPVFVAAEVASFGRDTMGPWVNAVEFSKQRFGG